MSDSTHPGFDTRAVHAGAAADPTTGSRAVPIYQTVAYNFRTPSTPRTCSVCASSATSTRAS